jgi:hypothetical protein
MEETLKKLGHAYSKTANGLSLNRAYYPIEIAKDEISCDSMHSHEVETIKCEYQRDFQIYERTVRGEQFEVTETKNEIVITVH